MGFKDEKLRFKKVECFSENTSNFKTEDREVKDNPFDKKNAPKLMDFIKRFKKMQEKKRERFDKDKDSKSEQQKQTKEEPKSNDNKQNKDSKFKENNPKDNNSKSKESKSKSVKGKAAATALNNSMKTPKPNEVEEDGAFVQKSSGDAFKDAQSGFGGKIIAAINPMTYIKKLLNLLKVMSIPFIALFFGVLIIGFLIVALFFAGMKMATSPTNGIDEYMAQYEGGARFSTLSKEQQDEIIRSVYCDETQRQIISFALSKVGYEYSQPRRTSGTAFDCSSLAFYACQSAGVDIANGGTYPPTADNEALNMLNQGKAIYTNQVGFTLEPGDLVFYQGKNNSYFMNISHVAIYVGNGYCVEALGEKYGVVYNPLRTKNAVLVGKIK